MRFLFSAILVALLLAGSASALTQLWKREFTFAFPATYTAVTAPASADTAIFYDEWGAFVALDAATGATKWLTNFTGGLQIGYIGTAGLQQQFLVVGSGVGSMGALTVINLKDGSLVWNNTALPAWTILPLVTSEVIAVCSTGVGCTGYDVYSGGILYSPPVTPSPLATIVPCGDRALVTYQPLNNAVSFSLIDINTGSAYWTRSSADLTLEFLGCSERSTVRTGTTGAWVVDLSNGANRYQAPALTVAVLRDGMLCGTWSTPTLLSLVTCWDEFQGFVVVNATVPQGSTVSLLDVFEGQVQLTSVFPYNGIGPNYLNISGVDLNTGATLYNVVPPYNAVVGQSGVPGYVKAPNGVMVVPYLGGMTAWSRQGKYLDRSTTLSGISQLVSNKAALFVAYQSYVAAFSF